MTTKRKSFVIHIDSLDILDELTDEQAGKLLKAIKSYQKGEDLGLDFTTKIVFAPFKSQFVRDDEKYQAIVNRNKNNGLKGGRPKTQANPENPSEPSGLIGNPENPSEPDSVNDSDSVSGSVSGNKKKEQKITPSKEDHCPHQEVIDAYHQALPTMSKVRIWSDKRKSLLRSRWREDVKRQNIDWWTGFFEFIAKSDFLTGRTEKPFNCDLEWIVNSTNFVKIIEGKYHK